MWKRGETWLWEKRRQQQFFSTSDQYAFVWPRCLSPLRTGIYSSAEMTRCWTSRCAGQLVVLVHLGRLLSCSCFRLETTLIRLLIQTSSFRHHLRENTFRHHPSDIICVRSPRRPPGLLSSSSVASWSTLSRFRSSGTKLSP